MKNLFLVALVAALGFIACDTPAPATTNPSDSTGNSTQPTTDTAKVDTTKNQ